MAKRSTIFKRWLWRLLLLSICAGILAIPFVSWWLDPVYGWLYPRITHSQPITTEAALMAQYKALPKVPYDSLPEAAYVVFHEMHEVDARYRKKTFVRVTGLSRYRYLVGKHQLRDFCIPSRVGGRRVPDRAWTQYTLIDLQLLRRFLQLYKLMEIEGLDPHALSVTSAFRPPRYNRIVGGKSRSRHLFGDAIDIWVGDVNRNGKQDQEEVAQVYELLNRRVIGQKGGVGRYKRSDRLIHLDTRGHRARWHY